MSLRTRFITHSSFRRRDRKRLRERYNLHLGAIHCFLDEVVVIDFPTETRLSSISRKARFPHAAGILKLERGTLVVYIGQESMKWLIH